MGFRRKWGFRRKTLYDTVFFCFETKKPCTVHGFPAEMGFRDPLKRGFPPDFHVWRNKKTLYSTWVVGGNGVLGPISIGGLPGMAGMTAKLTAKDRKAYRGPPNWGYPPIQLGPPWIGFRDPPIQLEIGPKTPFQLGLGTQFQLESIGNARFEPIGIWSEAPFFIDFINFFKKNTVSYMEK